MLSPRVYRWKIHDTHTGGVPDCYYEGPVGLAWVEYKYIKKMPVKPDTQLVIALSPLQLAWLKRTVNHGQRAMVVVGHEDQALILPEYKWKEPVTKKYYEKHSVPKQHIATIIETLTLEGKVSWMKKK